MLGLVYIPFLPITGKYTMSNNRTKKISPKRAKFKVLELRGKDGLYILRVRRDMMPIAQDVLFPSRAAAKLVIHHQVVILNGLFPRRIDIAFQDIDTEGVSEGTDESRLTTQASGAYAVRNGHHNPAKQEYSDNCEKDC